MDPRYKSPGANVDRDEESEFRDLEVFTNSLKWMLRIGAVLAAFGLISAWMQLDLLSREFDVQEGRANDLRQAAVVGIGALVRLAAIIIFGRWIVLAHRNLPALGARYVEFTPGWALGCGSLSRPCDFSGAAATAWNGPRSRRTPGCCRCGGRCGSSGYSLETSRFPRRLDPERSRT